MKKIKLTQEKYALCDDKDYEELSKWKWCARKRRHTFYAERAVWKNGKTKTIRIHNQILGIKGIDHINGSGLDNRRCNLRPATQSQNNMNRGKYKDATSKFKGVYLAIFNKGKYKYWKSQIQNNGKKLHLGYFKTEHEAAEAYDKAAKKFFGCFAHLNNLQLI